MDDVVSQDGQEKEMTVAMSFTAPLSVAQWVQEYMNRNKVNRSAVLAAAIEALREAESKAVAA